MKDAVDVCLAVTFRLVFRANFDMLPQAIDLGLITIPNLEFFFFGVHKVEVHPPLVLKHRKTDVLHQRHRLQGL